MAQLEAPATRPPNVPAAVKSTEKARPTWKRRPFVSAVALLTLLGGMVGGRMLRATVLQPRISLADFYAIYRGMSRSEVKARLGLARRHA